MNCCCSQCRLFDEPDDVFLSAAAHALSESHFMAGDTVYQCGSIAEAMYFVMTGSATAIDRSGAAVIATHCAGCCFGEIGLFFDTVWTHTVLAANTSNHLTVIFEMRKEMTAELVKRFPLFRKRFEVLWACGGRQVF